MLPTLTDGPVTLRPWRPSDAEDLQREVQDPEIVRWMALDVPYPVAVAEEFIAGCAGAWERREAAHFVITDHSDRLAGYLGVLAVEEGMRVVEVGYWVAESHRRRGMATAAVRMAVGWIERSVRPARIELGMLAPNPASRAVAERTGFVFDRAQPSENLLDGGPAEEWVFVYRPER